MRFRRSWNLQERTRRRFPLRPAGSVPPGRPLRSQSGCPRPSDLRGGCAHSIQSAQERGAQGAEIARSKTRSRSTMRSVETEWTRVPLSTQTSCRGAAIATRVRCACASRLWAHGRKRGSDLRSPRSRIASLKCSTTPSGTGGGIAPVLSIWGSSLQRCCDVVGGVFVLSSPHRSGTRLARMRQVLLPRGQAGFAAGCPSRLCHDTKGKMTWK